MPSAGRQESGKKLTWCQKFLRDFCPPFIEVSRQLKPWLHRMPSDYTDAFGKDNFGIVIGAILFMYFVNLAPSITLGALLNSEVNTDFTLAMALLATGFYLLLFGLLAGQPLALIGMSGPTFIMESAIASISSTANIDFKQFRFWVGIYCALWGFVCVGANASALAKHIRHSVEEVFNSFIGTFFFMKALFTLIEHIPEEPKEPASEDVKLAFYSKASTAGASLFLAFIMLEFCLFLYEIRRGKYFRRTIRKVLGSLAVPLGMLLIVAMDRLFFRGYHLPKVDIPVTTDIDPPTWINPPDYATIMKGSATMHGLAFIIGLPFITVIFTESSLNNITAMRNKSVKPGNLVFDHILLLIVFPIISGALGWPFVSGSTVCTLSSLVVLVKMDHKPPPGMPHRIIGTVEQRVSIIVTGILIGLSIFLGTILRVIPLAALDGMFLYMGIISIRDQQFVNRILTLMKRRKHWHDWEFVRGLPSLHILAFALIQTAVVVALVSMEVAAEFTTAAYISILFPIIILLYALLREFILPKSAWLNQYLHQLDHKFKLKPSLPIQVMPSVRSLAASSRANLSKLSHVKFQTQMPELKVSRYFSRATFSLAVANENYCDQEDDFSPDI